MSCSSLRSQATTASRSPSLHPERSNVQIRKMTKSYQLLTQETLDADIDEESYYRADPSNIRLAPKTYVSRGLTINTSTVPKTYIHAPSVSCQSPAGSPQRTLHARATSAIKSAFSPKSSRFPTNIRTQHHGGHSPPISPGPGPGHGRGSRSRSRSKSAISSVSSLGARLKNLLNPDLSALLTPQPAGPPIPYKDKERQPSWSDLDPDRASPSTSTGGNPHRAQQHPAGWKTFTDFSTQVQDEIDSLARDRREEEQRDRARAQRRRPGLDLSGHRVRQGGAYGSHSAAQREQQAQREREALNQQQHLHQQQQEEQHQVRHGRQNSRVGGIRTRLRSQSRRRQHHHQRQRSVDSDLSFADIGCQDAMEVCRLCSHRPCGSEVLRGGLCGDCQFALERR